MTKKYACIYVAFTSVYSITHSAQSSKFKSMSLTTDRAGVLVQHSILGLTLWPFMLYNDIRTLEVVMRGLKHNEHSTHVNFFD